MNLMSRRGVVRSAGALLTLPIAEKLTPVLGAQQPLASGAVPTNRLWLSHRSATSVSPDLVNFVKDHAARVVAAGHQSQPGDYSSLGDQFHMLGKHLASAGANRAIRKHCRQLLKAGAVPSVDPQAIAHAVSCVQVYSPQYSANQLLNTGVLPSSSQEWAVQMKKLSRKGLVKYCHQAGRQLNAMGRTASFQPAVFSPEGSIAHVVPADYHPAQAPHLQDICSLSQKLKFFACIGATVAAGLIVLAAVVAICGATALAACFGGAVVAGVFFTGFGLITGALLTACSAFLTKDYQQRAAEPASLLAT